MYVCIYLHIKQNYNLNEQNPTLDEIHHRWRSEEKNYSGIKRVVIFPGV